jgi:ADP-heptose:LPS heptosyltransferase
MRHLGDVVIASGLINSLHRHNPDMKIDILGRAQLREVAEEFGYFHEYIEIDIPLFAHHRKDSAALRSALETALRLRRRRYDYCINTIGDIRENLIGRVTGAKCNIAPVWERGHLFKRKMTDMGASWMTNRPIIIPARYASYYDSMEYFARQLGLTGLVWKAAPDRRRLPGSKVTVALHPGASHPSRRWPDERWRRLIGELHARGCRIILLGAPNEANLLLSAFGREASDQKLEIVTGDISRFVSSLAAAEVLIGMDSLSVHAAYALGVPAVVLNGSADPTILTPPGDPAVSAGHLCKHYPCFYAYPCQRTENEYVCVRGIEVAVVMNAVEVILEQIRHADRPVDDGGGRRLPSSLKG